MLAISHTCSHLLTPVPDIQCRCIFYIIALSEMLQDSATWSPVPADMNDSTMLYLQKTSLSSRAISALHSIVQGRLTLVRFLFVYPSHNHASTFILNPVHALKRCSQAGSSLVWSCLPFPLVQPCR